MQSSFSDVIGHLYIAPGRTTATSGDVMLSRGAPTKSLETHRQPRYSSERWSRVNLYLFIIMQIHYSTSVL